MRCLIVFSHPVETSYCAALCARATDALRAAGHEVRLLDLYAEGFDPVLGRQERIDYHTPVVNERPIRTHLEAIKWAEALVFIYPTWWYGLPAMLKGWLDRVWIPYVTFTLPEHDEPIRGLMHNVVRIVGISTSGASRLWLAFVGNPGRRTITRGVRALCHPRCKTLWLAHYNIDRSTAHSREAFLERVGRELGKLR